MLSPKFVKKIEQPQLLKPSSEIEEPSKIINSDQIMLDLPKVDIPTGKQEEQVNDTKNETNNGTNQEETNDSNGSDINITIPDLPEAPELDIQIPEEDINIDVPNIPDIPDVPAVLPEVPEIPEIDIGEQINWAINMPDTDFPEIKPITGIDISPDLPKFYFPEDFKYDVGKITDGINVMLPEYNLNMEDIKSVGKIRQGEGNSYGEIYIDDGIVLDVADYLDKEFDGVVAGTPFENTNGRDFYYAMTNPSKLVEEKGIDYANEVVGDWTDGTTSIISDGKGGYGIQIGVPGIPTAPEQTKQRERDIDFTPPTSSVDLPNS